MKKLLKIIKNKYLFGFGSYSDSALFKSLDREDQIIVNKTIARTEIGLTGLAANLDAVGYLCENEIPGSIIECGVWRGGSIKAMMHKFIANRDTTREFILFDTFAGMTEPTEFDKKMTGKDARVAYQRKFRGTYTNWCYAPLEEVQNFIDEGETRELTTRYIKGDVLNTIPQHIDSIEKIALLRLDTDWYESTKVELELLFPKIVENGILIIDDYGVWQGARKAADEYFDTLAFRPLFFRIDETRRMIIKRNVPLIG